jgi:tRNA pseudouridine38-40 synthase
MRNIKINIQYDGTEYSGWQIQVRETTIQGLLENAILKVTDKHSRVIGAGRTDAGVHALDQVAVFKTDSHLDPPTLLRALNANLPLDIRIINAEEADEDFHPRYRAKHKTYSYIISPSESHSVFLRRYSWNMSYSLNTDAMVQAAGYLIGKQDFSSFRASGCSSRHPVREIIDIQISKSELIDFMTFQFNTPSIKISITANAFLRHMVRNIVGTLFEIGRDKIPADNILDILNAKDRRVAGQTAPACGLFLEKMVY